MLFVFIDKNGDYLKAGPKTTAELWHDYYSPLAWDYRILVGQSVLVEVPQDAVAILFSNDDSYFYDNGDADGDWGVELSFSMIEKIDYYQVIKNPIIQLPSTIVDLVAGKNADIVVKTAPGINVEGSFVEWKSQSGTTTKTFQLKPGQTTSTSSGDVTFYIDPVPKEADYINKVTYPIVHLRGKNASGVIVDIDESDSQLAPAIARKTKQIRIGYVPISGCIGTWSIVDCFTVGPTPQEVQNLALYGGQIMRAMYPVAEDEFFSSLIEEPQPIAYQYKASNTNDGDKAINWDLLSVQKVRTKSQSQLTDYTVGVVSQAYWDYRKNEATLGQAQDFGKKQGILSGDYARVALVKAPSYYTLPHEIGHLLSLEHRCPGIEASQSCSENESTTYDGYNNNTVIAGKVDWLTQRGLVGDRFSLMRYGTGFDFFVSADLPKKKWISRQEYLTLFDLSIVNSQRTKRYQKSVVHPVFTIAGNFENGTIGLRSFYKNSLKEIYWPSNGEYVVEVKDKYKNIISQIFTSEKRMSSNDFRYLDFNMEVPNQALTIEIFKTTPQKTYLGSYSIPAAIIREDIKYINNSLVLGVSQVFKNSLNEMLNRFDKSIQCRSYGAAKQILSLEILAHIEKYLKNKNSALLSVEVDKSVLSGHVIEALSRLTAAIPEVNQPINPFVSLCLSDNLNLGQRSKLDIEFIKKPLGNGQRYVARAWFDSEEVEVLEIDGKSSAKSKSLLLGNHGWSVKTYIVETKTYDSIKKTLAQVIAEINTLQVQYNKETELDKKQQLEIQINAKQKRRIQLEMQLQNQLSEFSVPSNISFEVKL